MSDRNNLNRAISLLEAAPELLTASIELLAITKANPMDRRQKQMVKRVGKAIDLVMSTPILGRKEK
jgi:hypothetical protein